MLVPLTDTNNPYAVMMFGLIRKQQSRATPPRRPAAIAGTPRRRHAVRTYLGRLAAYRGHVSSTTSA